MLTNTKAILPPALGGAQTDEFPARDLQHPWHTFSSGNPLLQRLRLVWKEIQRGFCSIWWNSYISSPVIYRYNQQLQDILKVNIWLFFNTICLTSFVFIEQEFNYQINKSIHWYQQLLDISKVNIWLLLNTICFTLFIFIEENSILRWIKVFIGYP